ncbi:MAG: hypothetical protein IJF45_05190, partial [Clostridia bacterium]|nr:hypothetical protein [Clostridia bacterium]
FVFAARLVLESLPPLLSFFLAPHGVAAEKNAELAVASGGVQPPRHSSSVGTECRKRDKCPIARTKQKRECFGTPFSVCYGRLVLELLPPYKTSKFAVSMAAAEKKVGFCKAK